MGLIEMFLSLFLFSMRFKQIIVSYMNGLVEFYIMIRKEYFISMTIII